MNCPEQERCCEPEIYQSSKKILLCSEKVEQLLENRTIRFIVRELCLESDLTKYLVCLGVAGYPKLDLLIREQILHEKWPEVIFKKQTLTSI